MKALYGSFVLQNLVQDCTDSAAISYWFCTKQLVVPCVLQKTKPLVCTGICNASCPILSSSITDTTTSYGPTALDSVVPTFFHPCRHFSFLLESRLHTTDSVNAFCAVEGCAVFFFCFFTSCLLQHHLPACPFRSTWTTFDGYFE